MTEHEELLDRVNQAPNEALHNYHLAYLDGWRDGLKHCGKKWSCIDADLWTMQWYGEDRPMCCGVLLDWSPKLAEQQAEVP